MLERILEESGLRKDRDYVAQASGMGLRGEAENILKPDVIVNLPDGKHIVIDSKVSLVAYERHCSEPDEALKLAHLKEFLKSIRSHVDGLEQKRYQDIEKLGTPDFVLMFMPVEGAYSLAVQQNSELHSYAWGKKIVIVCPATLFATLRTIASLWRIEMQNQNAQEIARVGGALYDKFAGLMKDMSGMGEKIGKLQEQYDQMRGKLSEGKGNLLSRVEKLRVLGAKTSQSLPKEFTKEEGEAFGVPEEAEATNGSGVIENFPKMKANA
jgi:DNA recombination protein RmuC